ncbi:P-loop containing nucleoside triphosphate hydrolase protein, partial [Tothia fuscella]
LRQYFHPKTQIFYEKNGSPLRRSWLLYGPPGTGKTSLALAVATHFKIELHIIGLHGLDDDDLRDQFSRLPPKCVVLLEDIDCAGIQSRKQGQATRDIRSNATNGDVPRADKNKPQVTLQGLLNVIDGIGAPEGQLLIMTSNSPRNLDRALYRSGRVNRAMHLGYSTPSTAALTFRRIYENAPMRKLPPPRIEKLSKLFGSRVKRRKVTPAEVQGYCLNNLQSPKDALKKFDEWYEAKKK